MPVNFLHGVETIEVTSGNRKISVVKSAVIGLLGIAPKGPSQSNVLVLNETDAAQFGSEIPGFNIPQALSYIFAQGPAVVVVVNVFDATAHTAQVTDEVLVLDSKGRGRFASSPLSNIVVKNNAGSTTYTVDVDYKVNEFGDIQVINFTSIAPSATIKVSYKKLDSSIAIGTWVTALTGSLNGGTGVRTGSRLFDLTRQLFGFKAKIFIAPNYSHNTTMAGVLIALADKFKAITYLDAPQGTAVSVAIAGRGPLGAINFNTSNHRAELLYPMLKANSKYLAASETVNYSAFMAGIRAATDNNEGFWVSSSNHEIKGITAMEIPISGEINDASTEANALNEVGITTLFNTFGTGIRTWGNRNASFPTNTDMYSFTKMRRTADILHESIEYYMIVNIDKDITPVLIDIVKEDVNALIRSFVAKGALVEGSKCVFLSADNPPEELAAGHATWTLEFAGYAPLERATFKSKIDINLLTVTA